MTALFDRVRVFGPSQRFSRPVLALVLLSTIGVAGCPREGHVIPDVPPPQPAEVFQPFNEAQAAPHSLAFYPPYRLNCGDVLEIIYHVKNIPTPNGYKLKIEDVIEIKFPYQASMNQEVEVAPDGKVNCLLLGPQQAMNLTVLEVQQNLKREYARYLREPELTVTAKAANKKITELKKAITTAPRGQSRLIPIKPDGTIDLPYVSEVLAFGKTVRELKAELDRRYIEADLEEVEVTVQTLEFSPRNIFVMGEVIAPGQLRMTSPATLLQCIAAAGGMNPRAERQKVLVVRRKFLPVPSAVVVDTHALLTGQKPGPDGLVPNGEQFRYDFYLQDEDFVYVPTTQLALQGDWIDQVFNRIVRPIFPVSGNVGMNFGYQIYNAPSSFESRQAGPPRINAQVGP